MKPLRPMIAAALLLHASVPRPADTQEAGPILVVRVTDADDGRPVAGANIVIGDSARYVGVTNAQGEWTAATRPGFHKLVVRVIGYAPAKSRVDVHPAGVTLEQVRLTARMVPLGAVVVTASRREQRLADAVVETELVSRAELERSGASDLASGLSERIGIQIDGGVPAGAGVQLRGFNSRRVLVLLDGVPVTGRVNGNLDLSRLPLSNVERVEIVKGPQSVLYGSDAIGGVINVITRTPPNSGLATGASATIGSHGRRDGAVDASFRAGPLGIAADVAIRDADLAPGVAGDEATYARRRNGAAKMTWNGANSWLQAAAMLVDEQQRYRAGQLFNFADNTQLDGRLTAGRSIGLSRVSVNMAASTFDHLSRQSTRELPVTDDGAHDRQRTLQAELLWNGLHGPLLVDAGIALKRESIVADRISEEAPDLTTMEPFGQVTWSLGSVTVTPGIRLSRSDRWGQFLAPRLAVMARPSESVALRASLGQAFRAPDFKELYLEFVNEAAGYAVMGNPDLRPERSRATSLGLEWTGKNAFARATAFANEYRDFIETGNPDPAGTYTYSNVLRGHIRGFELEGGLRSGSWRWDGGVEVLRTRDLDSGLPLLGRPRRTLRLAGAGPLVAAIRSGVSATLIGPTPLASNASGQVTSERGSFFRLDARISRQLPGGVNVHAGVNNVLDRRMHETWPGFTGRQVYLQLRWHNRGATDSELVGR